jgi:DNA-binding NarL/FixJ family response regulator
LTKPEAVTTLVPIRILTVDESARWRRTIFSILKDHPEWQIISEAEDGVKGVQNSEEHQPDLILLDVALPELNGIETARRIRQVAPDSKIVFLSDDHGPEVLREALRIGSGGYVLKADATSDLLPALRAVMEDRHFVSSKFSASTRNHLVRVKRPGAIPWVQ